MKYIPLTKLLKINQISNINDPDVRLKESNQSNLEKILNKAKAEQRIADMRMVETKIERLANEKSSSEKILSELRFFAAERKAIATAIIKQN